MDVYFYFIYYLFLPNMAIIGVLTHPQVFESPCEPSRLCWYQLQVCSFPAVKLEGKNISDRNNSTIVQKSFYWIHVSISDQRTENPEGNKVVVPFGEALRAVLGEIGAPKNPMICYPFGFLVTLPRPRAPT